MAAEIGITNCTVYNSTLSSGVKEVIIDTPTTADSDDYITLVLKNYGITTLKSIFGVVHTTDGSVIATEAPTTAVTTGTLVITVTGSSVDDKRRVYTLRGV